MSVFEQSDTVDALRRAPVSARFLFGLVMLPAAVGVGLTVGGTIEANSPGQYASSKEQAAREATGRQYFDAGVRVIEFGVPGALVTWAALEGLAVAARRRPEEDAAVAPVVSLPASPPHAGPNQAAA
jgi:hypothetical protein